MVFIILLIAGALSILGITLLCNYNKYKEAYNDMNDEFNIYHQERKKTILTYDQFIKFYSICPDKWSIGSKEIYYEIPKEKREKYRTIWGVEERAFFYIKFAKYSDYRKYMRFYLDREKRQKEMRKNQEGLEFVALMENECNLLREKSMKTIAESAENTKKIVEEMQNPNWDIRNYMPGKFTYEKRPEGTIVVKQNLKK